MIEQYDIVVKTNHETEYVLITEEAEKAVKNSGIQKGLVFIVTNHTTTGITVNEGLECLEDDFSTFFSKLVPNDGSLNHARFLESYGAMANNGPSHIKALLTGNHTCFNVSNGVLKRRFAQEIYFCEYDGPQDRTITITVIGE